MSGGARWAATIGAAALVLLVLRGPALARMRWSACMDVEAECSQVRVPLDRTGAVPGTVRLRLARFGEPSAKPTLLYLSGGPGGAGIREFADVLFELQGLDRRYQLVSYDQRGTGSSGLIRCPALGAGFRRPRGVLAFLRRPAGHRPPNRHAAARFRRWLRSQLSTSIFIPDDG
jgi:pimeloyl-ACP methyl ester carboxylesterase